MTDVIKYLEEIKEHQMNTVQLARSTEVYKLADKALKAIAVIQCSTQLNAGFKIGDKVVSKYGRICEIIDFPKHGHARVRNDVGGGIWQPDINELKLHKSV
ncbi:MAG: hypothetical protein V7767_05170 [Leeuwenhoekiella sp.]